MATLTITINDAKAAELYEALCVPRGLPASGANAKTVVMDILKTVYRNHKGQQAAVTAEQSAKTQADAELVLS